MTQLHAKVKALVLQLLPGSVVTGGEIESTLDQVLAMLKTMHPDAEFDRETLLRELEAALNIFQAEDVMMRTFAGSTRLPTCGCPTGE